MRKFDHMRKFDVVESSQTPETGVEANRKTPAQVRWCCVQSKPGAHPKGAPGRGDKKKRREETVGRRGRSRRGWKLESKVCRVRSMKQNVNHSHSSGTKPLLRKGNYPKSRVLMYCFISLSRCLSVSLGLALAIFLPYENGSSVSANRLSGII